MISSCVSGDESPMEAAAAVREERVRLVARRAAADAADAAASSARGNHLLAEAISDQTSTSG